MRITSFLLLGACLHAGARGLAQTVTLSEKNAPLQKVFREIHRQTGYQFVYQDEVLDLAGPVTIELRDVPLEQALAQCFRNLPITYTISNNAITVTARAPAPVVAQPPPAATIDIHGRVTDSLGNPMAGASVTVKGTKMGTVTNGDGYFTLKGMDATRVTLVVSFTGYDSREYRAGPGQSLVIMLSKNNSPLDEIQVIAYGTTSKRFQTGNVATVKGEDIARQPVNNPLLALEGRVPGLFVTQASGFSGSGVKVRIQGENSIAGGNDPLYVIDGVPYISQLMPSFNTTTGSSGGRNVNYQGVYGSPLSFINPADIESIEILKDADATAIYGSRAANGAVLITTRKGKTGEQKVDFNLQQGWGKVGRRLHMLNLRQYLDMRYEALKNDGLDLNSGSASDFLFYDLKVWDTTRSTDWQKALIGNTAGYTDLQTSVSGGNTTNSYVIGAGYHRETTVLPTDLNDQKASVHFQINSSSANQKFKLQFSGNYMIDINRLPLYADGRDITNPAFQLAPDAPPLLNKDGSVNWAPDPNGNTTWDAPGNPMALLQQKYVNKTSNLVSDLLLSYQLFKNLQFKSSIGYTSLETKETATIPFASVAPEFRPASTRTGIYGNSTVGSVVIEPQISYEKNIGKGRFETLVGFSIQDRNSDAERILGFGYSTDAAIDDMSAASSLVPQPSIRSTYKYNAAFGRVNCQWDQKYMVNITGRRDGSSRFGEKDQFQNFGAIGVGWIFSQEKFIPGKLSFLSFGKLRASYGITGNDQIGDYQYLSTYSPVTVGVPYQGITTYQSNGLANPYLHWETTKKLFAGLDLGFFKDKFLLDLSYFRNRSSNQLLGYRLPISTGFASITENFPALVQNTGWEFSLSSRNLTTKKLRWTTNINVTIPQNKLINFPNLDQSSYASTLVVGQPITVLKKFHLLGVDPGTGLYYFNSKNNPFLPTAPADNNVLINTTPKFYGGIENSFSCYGFQLDFLFQFVKQIGANFFYGWLPGTFRLNQPVYVLDRWRKPGDVATHQLFDANYSYSNNWYNNVMFSDGPYADASYIRLKNISLSYQLPARWLKGAHIQAWRMYTQAQNLLTFTRYKGLDPETLSTASLPPLRVITVGVQATL